MSPRRPGSNSYDEVLPLMLIRYCGPGLLGLGITALVAGFMSGMAGNVSAFSTVWTYDIYGAFMNKKASDSHYVAMGRWSTVMGMLVSIASAYLVTHATGIMDYVQALFSFFIAPLFGTVVLGMLWKRATKAGGFLGLLTGTLASIAMFVWVHYQPSALKYVAINPQAAADGREPVSRAVELDYLRRGHNRREFDGEGNAEGVARRTGVWSYADSGRWLERPVPKADLLGDRGHYRVLHPQHRFLLNVAMKTGAINMDETHDDKPHVHLHETPRVSRCERRGPFDLVLLRNSYAWIWVCAGRAGTLRALPHPGPATAGNGARKPPSDVLVGSSDDVVRCVLYDPVPAEA